MSSPLVSVVIPMLDAAPTIERCLQSCLSLAWGALEIIVVDNGSVDDSRERVVRLAGSSRCPILLLECEERGPGVARNHAMPHVHGDYVVWLDADDALFRDKIAEQVEALRPFRDTPAIASCDVIVENIRTGNDAVVDSIFSLLPTASERVACQHSPVVFAESLAAGTAQAFPMLAPAFSRLLAAAERLLETRLLRWVDAATAAALCRARGR